MNQQNPKTGFNNGTESNFGGPAQSQFGGSQFGGSQFGAGGGAGGAGGGEFSNAGFGGTNAVSQIFKDGSYEDDKRKRIIIAVAAVVAVGACGAAAWWLFSADDAAKQEAVIEQPIAAPTEAPAVVAEEAAPAEEEEVADDSMAEDTAEDVAAPTFGGETSFTYDARRGGITINATAGSMIEVSRSASFADRYASGIAKNGQFQIPLPPPGKIYWREQGMGQVNTINVTPPESASVSFSAPQQLASGSQLTWTGSGPISYYRVEFATDQSFTNVVSAMATSQSSIAPANLTSGTYFVRVGALNAAAGQFVYSSSSNVTVP